ncbi:MAG: PD-(D/E)XK nuclease family protein [Steroidobacteraceae bacterium]
MKIRFGLDLDGEHGGLAVDSLGEATVGPQGLLGLLETQLGLPTPPASPAERIAAFRAGLAACDGPQRFYHRSFEADPLGTAATLLRWRDDWHLHGWARDFDPAAPVRLLDLQEVEDRLDDGFAPSVGERLAAVIHRLDQRRPPIDELRLVDPVADFPARWRALLARLPVVAAPAPAPGAAPGSLLADLQCALLALVAGRRPARLAFRDDGSFTAVRAETRLLAARWLAATARDGTALLVAGDAAALLDRVQVAAGRSAQGFGEPSAFRPALALLPLALSLLWAPLDFHALLQFLTHPVCPLPGFARRILARELAERPGIGGRGWHRALAAIDARPEAGTTDLRALVDQWIEVPRHRADAGLPLDVVCARVALVRDWFRRRLAVEDENLRLAHRAGHEQCIAVAAALETLAAQGVARLSREQLQKLLVQATGGGAAEAGSITEVGALRAVEAPGAVIDPCGRVIWWQPIAPALPRAWPFSRAELAALAAAGVELPDTASRLAREARAWCRPVLAAERNLTLVLPPRGEEAHPLSLMIESLVAELPVRSLETLLTRPERTDAMERVMLAPIAPRRRWWRLPADVPIVAPPRASYSNLEKLVHNPYVWLLEYPARLRASDLLRVAEGSRLCGTLAHALVERWVRLGSPLGAGETTTAVWFERHFEALIDEEGAVLRLPGRQVELAEFRLAARIALRRLHGYLRSARAEALRAEQPLEGTFDGGTLVGSADLVVTRGDGHAAVIDMKWTRRSADYRAQLAEGRHLQLAIYAELLRQATGHQPDVAYFMLRDASLHAPDACFFPEARVAAGPDAESAEAVWQRLLVTWRWRQTQFARGEFEVVLEGLEETPESLPPAGALDIEFQYEGFNDYLRLAGDWE